MLELFLITAFSILVVIGFILTIGIWAVVIGWIAAGFIALAVIFFAVMGVLRVMDKITYEIRGWKYRRAQKKKPAIIAP